MAFKWDVGLSTCLGFVFFYFLDVNYLVLRPTELLVEPINGVIEVNVSESHLIRDLKLMEVGENGNLTGAVLGRVVEVSKKPLEIVIILCEFLKIYS